MNSTPHQICEKFLEYIEKEKLDPRLVIGDEDFLDAPKHPDQDVRMAWFYLMDKLMDIEPERCISVLEKILTDPNQISFRTTFKYLVHSRFWENDRYQELSLEFASAFREHFDQEGKDDEFKFLINRLSSLERFPRGDGPYPGD